MGCSHLEVPGDVITLPFPACYPKQGRIGSQLAFVGLNCRRGALGTRDARISRNKHHGSGGDPPPLPSPAPRLPIPTRPRRTSHQRHPPRRHEDLNADTLLGVAGDTATRASLTHTQRDVLVAEQPVLRALEEWLSELFAPDRAAETAQESSRHRQMAPIAASRFRRLAGGSQRHAVSSTVAAPRCVKPARNPLGARSLPG